MSSNLNDKQKKFCSEYLVDYNATQAAIRAGYSKKTAGSQAHDLLKKPEIQTFLSSKKEKVANKLEISAERTLHEIGRLAYADIRALYNVDGSLKPLHELDDDTAATIASIESHEEEMSADPESESIKVGSVMKVKTHDKTKALEMLAKHFGIYKETDPMKGITIVIKKKNAQR